MSLNSHEVDTKKLLFVNESEPWQEIVVGHECRLSDLNRPTAMNISCAALQICVDTGLIVKVNATHNRLIAVM